MEESRQPHKRILHGIKHVHHHVKRHAWRLFIPHQGNNHQPHALRPRALRVYSIGLILVKVFVSGFLFLVYPSSGEFASITASQILSLTNASRAENGIASLSLNSTLNRAASLKAQDMIANNYFAHTSPQGVKPWDFLKRAGYSYSAAGENLAMDFTEAETVHTAFMNSPSHRENILNGKYTEMGIAVVSGKIDGRETTLLVEFFGKPYQQAAAVAQQAKPTPTPTPTPATQPKPAPAPKPAAQPVTYTAKLASQSAASLAIKTNEIIPVWVEFTNTGTATWTNSGEHFIALNVANPPGRESVFRNDAWKAPYRPGIMDQTQVRPGQNARFSFTLQAPAQAGTYEEDFGLVAENLTWIAGGSVNIPITVVEEQKQETPTTVEVVGQATPPPPVEQTPPPANTAQQPTNLAVPPANIAVEQPSPAPETQVLGEQSGDFVGLLVEISNKFFVVFLIFIIIALLLNILIRIRIQHPHLIFQTSLVIILAASAVLYKPHFLESVTRVLTIT